MDLMDELERLVDKHGLRFLLYALEEVCAEKAQHARTNWQCASTAKHWESCADVVSGAYILVRNLEG